MVSLSTVVERVMKVLLSVVVRVVCFVAVLVVEEKCVASGCTHQKDFTAGCVQHLPEREWLLISCVTLDSSVEPLV